MPPTLYRRPYKWFVWISALDIILTWFIPLFGGTEVNVPADAVISNTGLPGIVMYKFCLVVLFLVVCEWIGRRRYRTGRALARGAVVITAVPVALSVLQLVY